MFSFTQNALQNIFHESFPLRNPGHAPESKVLNTTFSSIFSFSEKTIAKLTTATQILKQLSNCLTIFRALK